MVELAMAMAGWTVGAMLAGAVALHLLPRLGAGGAALSGRMCEAPLLDLVITYFTVLPWLVGWLGLGLEGLLGAVIGQVASVLIWTLLHGLANHRHVTGPRILKANNAAVGAWRNYLAVWWTAWAVPVFWAIRVAEYVVYRPLMWLIGLPRYDDREWVNVSRQKFEGLVGHDLIWCLYCDWMTGVWSLGSEMLRNIESFWCPIRFHSEKKCENCAIDFPDIETHWIAAEGTMQEVEDLLRANYPPPQEGGPRVPPRPWFGHPRRVEITLEGRAPEKEAEKPAEKDEDNDAEG